MAVPKATIFLTFLCLILTHELQGKGGNWVEGFDIKLSFCVGFSLPFPLLPGQGYDDYYCCHSCNNTIVPPPIAPPHLPLPLPLPLPPPPPSSENNIQVQPKDTTEATSLNICANIDIPFPFLSEKDRDDYICCQRCNTTTVPPTSGNMTIAIKTYD